MEYNRNSPWQLLLTGDVALIMKLRINLNQHTSHIVDIKLFNDHFAHAKELAFKCGESKWPCSRKQESCIEAAMDNVTFDRDILRKAVVQG